MTQALPTPCSNNTYCGDNCCPPGDELAVLTQCNAGQCPPSQAQEVVIASPPDGPGPMLVFDPALPWGAGS